MAYNPTTEKRREYFAGYMSKPENALKQRARRIVQQSVYEGTMVRGACQTCGSTDKTHGHHDDYSKPRDVRWLCVPCHAAVHRAERGRVCSRGHELVGSNVRVTFEDGVERRRCTVCHAAAAKRRRASRDIANPLSLDGVSP